jgi:hypothetical protein
MGRISENKGLQPACSCISQAANILLAIYFGRELFHLKCTSNEIDIWLNYTEIVYKYTLKVSQMPLGYWYIVYVYLVYWFSVTVVNRSTV